MKDIHDVDTVDMAALESSFRKYRRIVMHDEPSDTEILRRLKRYRGYLREKPYLTEALRRS